jgi:hypothetical protein
LENGYIGESVWKFELCGTWLTGCWGDRKEVGCDSDLFQTLFSLQFARKEGYCHFFDHILIGGC